MTLLSAVTLALVLVCGVHTVFGCTCSPYPLHRQPLYCNNDVVFIGLIKKVFPPAVINVGDHKYRVKVKRIFKGDCKGKITVTTRNNGALCGITNLVKGEKYLITAKRNDDGTYRIALCSSLVLKKEDVTKEVEKLYNSKKAKSFPGKDGVNCEKCKIQYCGLNGNCGIVAPPPTTCTYFGDDTKIKCYNKLRCVPSASGDSCRWSSLSCGGPVDVITSP